MNVMGKLIFLVILYVLFALEEYFYVIFAVSLCVREWIETRHVVRIYVYNLITEAVFTFPSVKCKRIKQL